MYRWFALLHCLLLLTIPLPVSQPYEDLSPLIDDLRKGGFILYVRHGEASVGEDQPGLNLADCSTQRNLSAKGKEQAKKYSEAIRKLNIPVALPVESSPLCRTVQTAEIAFGTPNVTVNPFWLKIYELSENTNTADTQNIVQTFTRQVERLTPNQANKVIVAHSFPPGVGLGEIPSMGTVIVKPLGNDKGYKIIGRLTLEDLLRLAQIDS